MLTKEQRDEILRLVQECVAAGNEGGGKQALALCDYLDSITLPVAPANFEYEIVAVQKSSPLVPHKETCIGWEQCNLCATCSRFTTQGDDWLPLFIGSNPDYCPYYIKSPKPGDSNE